MMDGRHFENRKIAISRRSTTDFREILHSNGSAIIPKVIKVGQTLVEILHLMVFKIKVVRRLAYVKIWIFEQP